MIRQLFKNLSMITNRKIIIFWKLDIEIGKDDLYKLSTELKKEKSQKCSITL
ncbi:MAG: hypothetical protein KAV48_01215 [Methanomicrobia archaeon]|nr:hypothetical protein [Methanomicrobia archaeon]